MESIRIDSLDTLAKEVAQTPDVLSTIREAFKWPFQATRAELNQLRDNFTIEQVRTFLQEKSALVETAQREVAGLKDQITESVSTTAPLVAAAGVIGTSLASGENVQSALTQVWAKEGIRGWLSSLVAASPSDGTIMQVIKGFFRGILEKMGLTSQEAPQSTETWAVEETGTTSEAAQEWRDTLREINYEMIVRVASRWVPTTPEEAASGLAWDATRFLNRKDVRELPFSRLQEAYETMKRDPTARIDSILGISDDEFPNVKQRKVVDALMGDTLFASLLRHTQTTENDTIRDALMRVGKDIEFSESLGNIDISDVGWSISDSFQRLMRVGNNEQTGQFEASPYIRQQMEEKGISMEVAKLCLTRWETWRLDTATNSAPSGVMKEILKDRDGAIFDGTPDGKKLKQIIGYGIEMQNALTDNPILSLGFPDEIASALRTRMLSIKEIFTLYMMMDGKPFEQGNSLQKVSFRMYIGVLLQNRMKDFESSRYYWALSRISMGFMAQKEYLSEDEKRMLTDIGANVGDSIVESGKRMLTRILGFMTGNPIAGAAAIGWLLFWRFPVRKSLFERVTN